MGYKVALGITATVLGFVGYVPYIRDTLRGKTRPHVFSWFVWGVLEATAFFAQIAGGADAGAWATGASAGVALYIAGIAFSRKDKQIRFLDWIALSGALIGIILWRLAHDPLFAIVCVTLADAFGFIPTFRKSYHKPHEETVTEYVFSTIKWIVAFPALGVFTLTTMLYPASLIITNSAFAVMALWRRKRIEDR